MRRPTSALSAAAESFLRHQLDLKPQTIENYRKSLTRFVRHLGQPQVRDLTSDNVSAYAQGLVHQGHRFLARADVATLRVFSKWLVTAGVLMDDPLRAVKLPAVPKKKREPFTHDEFRAILHVASQSRRPFRERAILLLAFGCGLRMNEIRQLRVEDVDLGSAVVTVREETTKTEAGARQVPMDPNVVAAIDRYLKDERGTEAGYLFLNSAGRPFSYAGFGGHLYRLKQECAKAGVGDFKIHRARHFWASQTYPLPGMTIWDLQKMGGWKDIDSIKPYIHHRDISQLKRLPTALTSVFGRI